MQTHQRVIIFASLLVLGALSAYGSTLDVVFYDNHFGTLNDATGAYTNVGTLPVSASAGIAVMDGLLYVENMGSDLYTVDPVTGASSLVGATGLTTTAGAFAGDSDGLFEVDYSSNLYSIDPATGKGRLVGATGLVANNGSFDTSLSADGDVLYYTAGHAGAFDELYEINVLTGLATDLGSTGVTGIAGSAFVGGDLELFQYGQGKNYIFSAPAGSTDFVRATSLSAQILDGGAVFATSTVETSNSQFADAPEPKSGFLLMAGVLSLGMCLFRRR